MSAPRALMPPCSTLNCSTCASSESEMKDLRARKKEFSQSFTEKMWNTWMEDAKVYAKSEGSPFAILATTKIDKILMDKRLKTFQSSMNADEIRNCVMRYLYLITLQEVIPSERQYMENLIKKDDHFELVYQWRYRNYETLVKLYSETFWMLPRRCLRRGLELHMSRIPRRYCLRQKLPSELKKELLSKLEEDHVTLASKIQDFPTISEEMMLTEINSFVDHMKSSGDDRFEFFLNKWGYGPYMSNSSYNPYSKLQDEMEESRMCYA